MVQLFQKDGNTIRIIGKGDIIRSCLYMGRAVGNCHTDTGELHHIHIIFRIAKGGGMSRYAASFRTAAPFPAAASEISSR